MPYLIIGLLVLAAIGGIVFWQMKSKKKEEELIASQDQDNVKLIAVPVEPSPKAASPKDSVSYVRPAPPAQSGPRRFKKICLVCAQEFPDDYVGKCPDDGLELSRITDYLAPGTTFSEYYEIVHPLGSGGLSNVFLAKHISSGKEVALKLLHAHLASDSTSVQRFQREANALSNLSHPNLVSVIDFMVSSSGVPFIVMDYLEGESLEQMLKRLGRLNWKEAAEIFVEICKGLSHAHSKGIVHRDLKPGNIMLIKDKNGNMIPKVVDFGLVKANNIDDIGRLTETGEVFGSPMYMSPEQCQGQEIDRRSDVYSLAVVLYECLTGAPPFVGKNVISTLSMHISSDVPPVPAELGVPPWMVSIIQQALKKDPDSRIPSIEDFGAMIMDGIRASSRK